MNSNRAEAERWLGIAEKLLASRDLHGTRTFAIRAREYDPVLADEILAVVDTLLAAQSHPPDYYRILQLTHLCPSMELVASQYQKLGMLLNPSRNRLLFADQAFRLVSEAWSVLSNPSKKAIYDNELRLSLLGQMSPLSQQQLQEQQQMEVQTQLSLLGQMGQLSHQQPPPQPQSQPQHHHHEQPRQTHMWLNQVGQVSQPSFQVHEQVQRETPTTQVGKSPGSSHGRAAAAAAEERPFFNNQIGFAPYSQVSQTESTLPQQVQPNWTESPRPIQSNQNDSSRPVRPTQKEPAQQVQPNQTEKEPSQLLQVNQTEIPSSQNTASVPKSEATESQEPSFWTACPYCYTMFEYLKLYEDCSLRCQSCSRAFQAVALPSPPLPGTGEDMYFCCWGFFPVGISDNAKLDGAWGANWSPFSPMFPFTEQGKKKHSAPWVYYDDADAFVELSDTDDSSDEDWRRDERRKKKKKKAMTATSTKRPRGRPPGGNRPRGRPPLGVNRPRGRPPGVNRPRGRPPGVKNAPKPQTESVMNGQNAMEQANGSGVENLGGESTVKSAVPVAESSKRVLGNSVRKQMARRGKDLGKLDLNVEFSNEVEEQAPRMRQGNAAGYGEEDNIEGNGFFEGLDEFLSSLPILNVVTDDKVKAT